MSFESHTRPNQSRLEKWRSEITEMRVLNWPYRRISSWLLIEQNLSISAQAIRAFCLRREIKKARPSPRVDSKSTASPPRRHPEPVSKKEPLFDYGKEDSERPIPLDREKK